MTRRLDHHPALAQRHVLIGVGERREVRRQEPLARQSAHRADDAGIAHLVGADLAVHHVVAGFANAWAAWSMAGCSFGRERPALIAAPPRRQAGGRRA